MLIKRFSSKTLLKWISLGLILLCFPASRFLHLNNGNEKEDIKIDVKVMDLSGCPQVKVVGKAYFWGEGQKSLISSKFTTGTKGFFSVNLKDWPAPASSGGRRWVIVVFRKEGKFFQGIKRLEKTNINKLEIECGAKSNRVKGFVLDSDSGKGLDGAVVWAQSPRNDNKHEMCLPPVFEGHLLSPEGWAIGFSGSGGKFYLPVDGGMTNGPVFAWKNRYCANASVFQGKKASFNISLASQDNRLGIIFDGFQGGLKVFQKYRLFKFIMGRITIKDMNNNTWKREFKVPPSIFFERSFDKLVPFNRLNQGLSPANSSFSKKVCLFRGIPSGKGVCGLRFSGHEFSGRYEIRFGESNVKQKERFINISPVLREMGRSFHFCRVYFVGKGGEEREVFGKIQYPPFEESFSFEGKEVFIPWLNPGEIVNVFFGDGDHPQNVSLKMGNGINSVKIVVF